MNKANACDSKNENWHCSVSLFGRSLRIFNVLSILGFICWEISSLDCCISIESPIPPKMSTFIVYYHGPMAHLPEEKGLRHSRGIWLILQNLILQSSWQCHPLPHIITYNVWHPHSRNRDSSRWKVATIWRSSDGVLNSITKSLYE